VITIKRCDLKRITRQTDPPLGRTKNLASYTRPSVLKGSEKARGLNSSSAREFLISWALSGRPTKGSEKKDWLPKERQKSHPSRSRGNVLSRPRDTERRGQRGEKLYVKNGEREEKRETGRESANQKGKNMGSAKNEDWRSLPGLP